MTDPQHHDNKPSHPPPVKTRTPLLSNIGDQLAKAARRLSMNSSSSSNSSQQLSQQSSSESGRATSPDVRRKRNSGLLSPSSSNESNNINSKKNEKSKKSDLFNMKFRSANTSQQQLASSPSSPHPPRPQSPTPGNSLGPPTPSKETFWRGLGLSRQAVCTEDDYRLLNQRTGPQHEQGQEQEQQQPPQTRPTGVSHPTPPPLPVSTASGPEKKTAHASLPPPPTPSVAFSSSSSVSSSVPVKEGAKAKPIHDTTRAGGHRGEDMYLGQSTNTLVHHGHRHDGTANSSSYIKGCESKVRDDAQKDIPVAQAQPTSTHFSVAPMSKNNHHTHTNTNTNTMSQDLSSLSISSLQETESLHSDRSLIMEDAFEVYESYSIASSNTNSIIGSLRLGLRPHSEQDLYSLSNTSSAALSPSKAPLSALERIQLEQKRRSQEQERLAERILPSGKSKGVPTPRALPTREIPRELMPTQPYQVAPLPLPSPTQQFQQEPGPMVAAIHDAAMYDQLLTLASGPNRPRLPSQIEWQRGFEELRQKRKEQAAATNSVGRQNSTGSRHSQESSDGKSRRHSMPDMPHGQREDRDRRGDAFRNPMLVNQSGGACVSGGGGGGGGGKRRSGYEDREQQLQQPPIQQQSILESQVMDTSAIPRLVSTPDVGPPKAKKKGVSNKRPEISVPDQYIPRDDAGRRVASPVDNAPDKDAVDMAFDEMLASLSLPAGTRAQLESLPKDRKWAMLQSNDANPSLYHTPETMPPQFFVDALLEYSGKRKRLSKDQYQQQKQSSTGVPSSGASTKPTGKWRNQSATNPSVDLQQQSLQQQLLSMLGKNERRILEEREQVLKKLRVLIRNGSIRWTGEFIKAGGPRALLEFGKYVQRTEENKLGQRDRLLHQIVQCIKAIVPLEGGITSLVQESLFYSLMRTLSILEAPVLATKSKDSSTLLGNSPTSGTKVKTGFFAMGPGNRTRSSSIPKPMPTRFGYQLSFQSTPALTADQIPTFSNSTAAVNILTAILSRVPELRDSVLKESIADPVSLATTNKWVGDTNWTYSEWISYLKEILHLCGIESLPILTGSSSGTASSTITPVGAGLASMGSGVSGSSLSIFSLDMRRRRHTSSSPAPTPSGGIKYDAEEDREVLAYLTAHLELVSKLMFDMHMSSPVLAFAKSVKESQLGELLERLRSQYIRDQSLSAQVEDILIQLSMIPSTTRLDASLLARELPIIPPMEAYNHSQYHHQQHHVEQSLQPRPSSQQCYNSLKTEAKYDASLKIDTPLRSSSMDAFSRHPSTHSNQGRNDASRVQTKVKVSLSSPSQNGDNSPKTRKAPGVGQTDANNTGLAKQISIKRVSEMSQDGRATPEEYRPRSSTPSKGNRRPSSTDSATPSALGSRLPVVPPKSKHRPMSQDPKELFTRSESPLVNESDLFKQHHRRQTLDVLTSRSPDRESKKDEILTSSPRSVNTFGHGRRSSLNHNNSLAGLQDTCTESSSSSSSGGANSRRNSGQNTQTDRQTMILDAPIPPYLRAHQPSLSTDESSSCSSTTSSGFTATSASSVSPPSTQTRKHSLLVAATEGENLTSVGSKLQAAITRSDTRSSSSKDTSQYNDVDFDIQIHQNVVRQLASSSSKQYLSSDQIPGSIEASDPKVLMAPIIVPEDMALVREQYIQSQISGIVLPPFEMNNKDLVGVTMMMNQPSLGGGVQRNSSSGSSAGGGHHHNYNRAQLPPQPQVLVPFSGGSSPGMAPHLPQKAGARRVSGNSASHIPVLTMSANSSVGDEALWMAQ
ncbi:hypothetical protein BGZ59_002478 [Podila verticillata]|nr:hypothetical protein BGZ59_002478 [Podila verticillata]